MVATRLWEAKICSSRSQSNRGLKSTIWLKFTLISNKDTKAESGPMSVIRLSDSDRISKLPANRTKSTVRGVDKLSTARPRNSKEETSSSCFTGSEEPNAAACKAAPSVSSDSRRSWALEAAAFAAAFAAAGRGAAAAGGASSWLRGPGLSLPALPPSPSEDSSSRPAKISSRNPFSSDSGNQLRPLPFPLPFALLPIAEAMLPFWTGGGARIT
mmetsp:Transcript_81117/g.262795  ORF Transcript_81117/g.262795 Transcript_81117/m.262795 type:complete len:214 (+) Transcript_81117:1381-2022(+)